MNPPKITVPKPCHENWDGMAPDGKGRFCGACQKTVVDFTGMQQPEITGYLLANAGNRICGRFETSQLETGPLRVAVPREVLFSQTSFRKMFLLALLVTMGTTLLSCHNRSVVGELAPAGKDSVAESKQAHIDSIAERKKVMHTVGIVSSRDESDSVLPPPPPPVETPYKAPKSIREDAGNKKH